MSVNSKIRRLELINSSFHGTHANSQNVSGAQGTTHEINWDGTAITHDDIFTHDKDSDPEQITIGLDGLYYIKCSVYMWRFNTTSNRAIIELYHKVNGTPVKGGVGTSYSRANYSKEATTPYVSEDNFLKGDIIIFEMDVVENATTGVAIDTQVGECECIIRLLKPDF